MQPEITILHVDDDPDARRLVSILLEAEGYRLVTAEDGRQALAQAAALLPDLVLLDVMMPQIDGYEVCHRLRQHPLLGEVPVVMVTALDDRRSRLRGIEAGADDFVSKPFDGDELRARIRSIARLNRYRRLHQERTKLEWVVEQSDDGYLSVDENDTLLYVNPRARAYLGLEADQPLAGGFIALAAERYRLEPREAWARWPRPGASPLYLLRPETRHEGAFWLRAELLELPSGGGWSHLVRLRDETQRMTLGRSLWKFSSLFAHRLEAPLAIVTGSLEMLSRNATDYSETELERLADLALRSGQRLQQNIDSVLSFLDRSEDVWSEGFGLEHLAPLLRELASDLRLGLELHTDDGIGGQLPLSAVACELLLREILDNLGRRCDSQEPPPAISAQISLASGDGSLKTRARLAIRADSCQRPAAEIAGAWVPYHQRQGAGREDGRGLGSSMVGPLIWGVGGTLRVEAAGRQGVVLELTLPILPSA